MNLPALLAPDSLLLTPDLYPANGARYRTTDIAFTIELASNSKLFFGKELE